MEYNGRLLFYGVDQDKPGVANFAVTFQANDLLTEW